MKGKFEYSKKEGLPNGANEMETILKAFFEARMAPFFKHGGPKLFDNSERFKKRVMKKYPGLQNVYGEQGQNLNIHKDKDFRASDYGYGDIEFIFPGGDGTVKYTDDYQYTSPTPNKYTVAYNPKGAKKGDIFLDLMHGMRNDSEYMKLLDNFSSAVTQGRGDDMDYFYQMDADRGFAPDGKQRWDENYIDGILRSELSRKGLGRRTKSKDDYKLERSGNTKEIQQAADEIKQYLRAPKKLVYKKGGIIEESYELDEYVDGGSTQDFDKEEFGWQYKKEGDKYLTRRTGDTDWITAKGNALNAIKYDVYNETPEAVFDPTVVQSGSKQQQQTKQRGSYIKNLQENLLDEGYYIGPTYDDGINGTYTQNAYEAGVPSEEYNKKFKKTSLQTNPDVKVPTALVERAQGIERPKSPKLSANAALSLEESEEDIKEQPKQNSKGLLPGTQKKLTEGAQEKGARTESGEYNYIPVLDPDNLDEAYSHLDDFLIDYTWQGKDRKKMSRRFSEIHTNAGSCLKGAKMCNAEFVADKVGANSIAGLFNEIHQIKGTSTFDEGLPWGISADQTKYSIPSRAGSAGQARTGEYKDTKGFDAWEAADALIGEGLGTDMYYKKLNTFPDKYWNSRKYRGVSDELQKMIEGKQIPLGAIIFEGDAAGEYTDPKYGERARHAMTVIGFDKENGIPLIYDSGQIRRITDRQFDMPISRVVIPKGYENYTLENLKKGQALRYEQLGYDKEPAKVEYKSDDKLKPYVNTVKKGMHQHAYKIANDYNMDKDIMDKMQNRVVGLAEVESNFNNEGEETRPIFTSDYTNLFLGSGAKIATEGYLQDAAKYVAKWGQDAFNIESDVKGYQDWEVETEALANLKKQGVNPFAPGTTETESGQTRNLLQEEMNKMRSSGNYPEWDKDLDQEKPEGEYESSVGPLQIKKLPLYVERELEIDKSDLYGSTVDDDKELENSSAAALVHLVESYKKLEKKYNQEMDMNLTEDQLIDLATVAYNNASKANSEEFVKNYILNKELKDGYLTQVHAGESTYNNTPDKYAQEVAQFRAKYNVASSKDAYDKDLIARTKAQATGQEPLAPLKPSEQQAITDNVTEEEDSLSNLYNRSIFAELNSGAYGDEQPLAPLRRPYVSTTFKDGGEVQDIYDYLNNKLRHR
jgi:hypothetical protein